MRLTTLGTGTISLSPERSCAGYLVEAGAVRLLIDCGSGITRRLAELALQWFDISHVAFSHFHIDHHADFPSLVFAWKHARHLPRSAPVEIIGPPGTGALLDRLAAAYGAWVREPGFPLRVRELSPGEGAELESGLMLDTHKVPHTPESVAYSIRHGGRRIVYTGDTGPDESVGDWASGCDVLVAECSLPAAMAIPEHLTPESCAALAARARPGHLVLTHFYPPVEQVDVRAVIAARYAGPVTLARDGWQIDLEDE